MLRIRKANVPDFSKARNDRTAIVLYEEQHAQPATPTASIRPSNAGRRGDGAAFLLCHSMGHGPNVLGINCFFECVRRNGSLCSGLFCG